MSRLSYARERAPLLVAWATQAALLAAVWLLSPSLRADRVNLLYALLLIVVSATAGFLVDYLRFAARRRALERLPAPPVPSRGGASAPSHRDGILALIDARDQAHAKALSNRERAAHEDVEFFGAWIHELKTPLSVLRLLTGDAQNAPEVERQLDRLQGNLDRAMYYLRSSSLERDMVLRPVVLLRLARERASGFEETCKNRGITLTVGGEAREVTTDPKWLGFVVDQVLQNAVRYTPDGGTVSLRIGGAARRPEIVVEDSGMGIPEEDLPRVFDRGFTGAKGREFGESTGMGLYLARKLVDRLGHDIGIRSIEGRGTVVTIAFPRWGTTSLATAAGDKTVRFEPTGVRPIDGPRPAASLRLHRRLKWHYSNSNA